MENGQAAVAAPQPAQPAPKPVSQDLRGVPDPVARIQAILNAEKSDQQPQAEQAPAPQEQVPAKPEAQPEPDAPAVPNKQVEGDEAPPEDARGYAEIPLDQLEAIELEVTVKGEEGKDITEKLPVKALREGYMRQKDYQRKTAEVARQRAEVGETVRQAVESERSGYQQSLQQMQAILLETVAPELKDVNWNDLAANNAFEYVRLRNRADQIAQAFSQLQAKQTEVASKQTKEQTEARQKLAAKARETLEADIPGWNDALYQTLMKSGESYGFKPEEVGSWVDARAIKLLHKAHLYDQLQADKKSVPADKRVAVVPPKVVRPGAVQQTNQRAQQEQGAMKKLQSSGKMEDAAAVIRSRMG